MFDNTFHISPTFATILHFAGQHKQRPIPTRWYHDPDASLSFPETPEEPIMENTHDSYEWEQAILSYKEWDHPFSLWLKKYYDQPQQTVILSHLIAKHLQACESFGAQFVTIADPAHYPESLRHLPNPPFGFSYLGELPHPNSLSIAIIGSRRASQFALEQSYRLGELISQRMKHICVVSGGAYGCDIAAHKGCLAYDKDPCQTSVVFAGGLGCLYPAGNLGVFSQVIRHGGSLISEKFWFTPPKPYDFPIRNRLISGLSEKIIVIHATLKSGAMSTCHHALDQGKEIYALCPPGNDVTMDGNQQLIDDGAHMFFSVDELLWNL